MSFSIMGNNAGRIRNNAAPSVLIILFLFSLVACAKKELTAQKTGEEKLSAISAARTAATTSLTPGDIFLGTAFNMEDMGLDNAAGWQSVRNYGAGLHVHPVAWRGKWQTIGEAIKKNMLNNHFTYEFDIVDVRGTTYNNIDEVNYMRQQGFICSRVLCNVDTKELDMNDNLPEELLETVVKPFNNIGIAVDILFSPISPSAVALDTIVNKTHIQKLQENARWIDLIFNRTHAQGVGFDYPVGYWTHGFQDNILPLLYQTQTAGKEITWMVNFDLDPNNNIDFLYTLYTDLDNNGLLPARWIVNNFASSSWSPVPEKETSAPFTKHPAGAALWLCKQTGLPEPDPEVYLYPDQTKYYNIIGKQSGKCIDVSNISQDENAPVWIWDYIGDANQQWQFVITSNGFYKIISKYSGKCLALITESTDNGVNLVQQAYTGSYTQQWKIVSLNNGDYKIVNLYSGKCVDVQGYSTVNGGNIWQYDYLNTDNQKWAFTITGNAP